MAITFDRVNKIILIGAPDTSIDIQTLYNVISDYQDNQKNMDLPRIAVASGKQDLGNGVFVGITVQLLLGWTVQFEARLTPTICNVNGGNLVATDVLGASIFPLTYSAYVMATLTSSSSSTLQELSAVQYSSYNGGVYLDVDNGVAGTAYPIGTPAYPVNNITDAKTIATFRGFKIINLLSDLTILDGTNIDEFTLRSDNWMIVTLQGTVSSINTIFEKVSVYGALGGFWNTFINCWIYDLTNCCAWVVGGSFVNIELAPYTYESAGQTYFDGCTPMYPNINSVITMNNGTSIASTTMCGDYEIKSLTAGSQVDFGFETGNLTLDSSCTGGTITIAGVGDLIDNSTGTIVQRDAFLCADYIAENVASTIIDTDIDIQKALKVLVSVIAGKANGGNTSTINFRDRSNVANVVTMTVDVDGNRSNVVIN